MRGSDPIARMGHPAAITATVARKGNETMTTDEIIKTDRALWAATLAAWDKYRAAVDAGDDAGAARHKALYLAHNAAWSAFVDATPLSGRTVRAATVGV